MWTIREIVILSVTTLAVTTAVVLPSYPSVAAEQFSIAFTSAGVTARTGPSLAFPKTGSPLTNGATVQIACEQRGTAVTNIHAESVDVWERLTNGTWLPNAFVDTGVTGWTPGLPRCGYDRGAAARWARANEQVPISGVDGANQCAAFISMVLWAGGVTMTASWNLSNRSGLQFIRADTMMRGAAASGVGTLGRISFADASGGSARQGDVVGYDWGGDGLVDHVAVVTGVGASGVTVTQRSHAQQDRPWNISWVTMRPLKESYPYAQAWLLRVTG